jgi:hypothetical protein
MKKKKIGAYKYQTIASGALVTYPMKNYFEETMIEE